MEGHLLMSSKERLRKSVFDRVTLKLLKLKEASVLLNLSYRQTKRSYRRYKSEGDSGLLHRSRARVSNRGYTPEFKSQVLSYYRDKLSGFGPTLACEKLGKKGLTVGRETLRRWLIEAGLLTKKRRHSVHRSWREPRGHFGELVQMDGSPHHWFGPEGGQFTLMNMVDDATGCTLSIMAKGETVAVAMQLVCAWIVKYGIPKSLYVDQKNIFKSDREPTLEEQLANKKPMTTFETACYKLGIEIITAYSPQAKGRVERNHRTYQDRFVKELRFRGITTLEGANELLRSEFCDELNAKFAKCPRESADFHRAVPRDVKLENVFVYEDLRRVSNDWTISLHAHIYQIHSDNKPLPKRKDEVTVRTRLDGHMDILYHGKALHFSEVTELRPKKPAPTPTLTVGREQTTKPSRTHPWRQKGALLVAESSHEYKKR